MPLSNQDRQRLIELIQRNQFGGLSKEEEKELRRLLQQEDSLAETMTVSDLITLALVIIGAASIGAWIAKAFDNQRDIL